MSLNIADIIAHKKIGICITGSFCSYQKLYKVLKQLSEQEAELYPILSYHAASLDSRFGEHEQNKAEIEKLCQRPAITTIPDAEPFGPKLKMDAMVILPCTGNTLSKLSNAITDTPVLMAAKAHLRNNRPLILALASNDGLGLCMKNLGLLMNAKNIYFVPYGQDDYVSKPNSLVAHMELLPETIALAIQGKQLQPVIRSPF